ncbi:cytochrome ubiquinol oxidase subunit I [Allokutzneria albata]|uniref:Cytochrome d ubiquinol oxidase subunit I n=1 Tax=Allokutzneria albata TaxID=211114 RepID=A0A1H0CY06_ALLAB|nr:cytochrome ubiquinol oxidase subunit I [Allokutzneria albata]SDN62784.1 cytochrome d ubiquinol oxidase subunit I [Allokutzneria albata]
METLDLARLQFALTAGAHFLFVALTLGLATVVAVLQTRATLSPTPARTRMTRFWGQLYVTNYAMGIVTGLVMEFQFGLSWSGLTHFAGNVFGASLAMETLVAFFIESTFLGLWIFGWDRLNRWAHLAAIWVVTLTAYASAYWILVSNGFLQNPVGYEVVGDSLRLTDVWAVLSNPNTIMAFWHVLTGALVTAGFFLAGVSAYHLLRRTRDTEFFTGSLRIGVFTGAPALLASAMTGGIQLGELATTQPMKPKLLGGDAAKLAQVNAQLVERFGPGDYLPPADWARAGGLVMLITFALLFNLGWFSVLMAFSKRVVQRFRLWHLALVLAIPLPFLAMIAGWVYREVGRQPWVVYGLLRTSDAVSPVSAGQMRASLIAFTVLFGLLIAVNTALLARQAKRGPDAVALGRPAAEYRPAPLPAATY